MAFLNFIDNSGRNVFANVDHIDYIQYEEDTDTTVIAFIERVFGIPGNVVKEIIGELKKISKGTVISIGK